MANAPFLLGGADEDERAAAAARAMSRRRHAHGAAAASRHETCSSSSASRAHRCWRGFARSPPGSTLARAVSPADAALGVARRAPLEIETLSNRGYRESWSTRALHLHRCLRPWTPTGPGLTATAQRGASERPAWQLR